MEEIKHTPGPWQFSPSGTVVLAIVTREINGKIRTYEQKIATTPSGLDVAERVANARLIAASPDLLEALILLEAEMVLSGNAGSTDYGWKPAIEKTRAAIAKAIGAQS